jgi:hypothetical protein
MRYSTGLVEKNVAAVSSWNGSEWLAVEALVFVRVARACGYRVTKKGMGARLCRQHPRFSAAHATGLYKKHNNRLLSFCRWQNSFHRGSNVVQSLLVSRGDFSCGMTRGRRTRGEPEALAPLLSRGSYPADNPERPRHFTATTPRPPKPSTSRPSPPLLLDTSSPPRLSLPSSTSSSTLDFAFASVRAPTRDL